MPSFDPPKTILLRARLEALSVPLLYALFGILWILISDLVLGSMRLSPETTTRIAMIKGWIFVGGSTLLVGVVMRKAWSTLEGAYRDLENELVRRKRTQEELAALARELEARVEERTRHLEAALRELELFGDSISHDLRAPLRAMAGYASALEEDCADALGEEGRTHVVRLQNAAHRMERMIQGLLELSRHGRAGLHLEVVPPDRHGRLVDEIWKEVQVLHPGRTWRFTRGVFPATRCDPRLLEHVWRNLLSNAAKYTRQREEAAIDVAWRDGWFRVRDNGIGFDPAMAERIFRPFERLHRADEYEGDGIGLALVERVIRRHGGEIAVESKPGEGSEFRFRLPDCPES